MESGNQYRRIGYGQHGALHDVEERLGHRFTVPELLVQALTHPSFSVEQDPVVPDNQRLEFLGDAVLQLIATERLFGGFAQLSEGPLTKLRSAITKEDALVEYAGDLRLGPALLLGRGEERSGGRQRPSNLADAFEAVLGAVYLDAGLEGARVMCLRLGIGTVEDVEDILAAENPKGALQEIIQESHHVPPTYEVLRVDGPEHEPEFEVRVCVGDEELARAVAGSRRLAEREAALKALGTLREVASDD